MTIHSYTGPVVMDYETGRQLRGVPSEELVTASREEQSGTGAVAAYYDETVCLWEPMADADVARHERMGVEIVTVYIED